jgi:hypothetical protein
VVAVVVTWVRLAAGREGQAFTAWAVVLLSSMATVFGAAFPVVGGGPAPPPPPRPRPGSVASPADSAVAGGGRWASDSRRPGVLWPCSGTGSLDGVSPWAMVATPGASGRGEGQAVGREGSGHRVR